MLQSALYESAGSDGFDYMYATKEGEVVMLWRTLLLRLEGFGYGNQLLHDVYHLIR